MMSTTGIPFSLQVKCERQKRGGGADHGGAADRPTNSRVVSADLEWIPQGEQASRFRDEPIRPVAEDILIAKLRPGQEIELEAWCEKGTGKTHAKWSPVCTASYRLLPEIRLKPSRTMTSDDARQLHSMCPTGVFDIEEAPGGPRMAVTRPRKCTMGRKSVRPPGWDEEVRLSRVKDHFIFTIESTGALPPDVLFQEAIKVFVCKAADIASQLKESVAAQANLGL